MAQTSLCRWAWIGWVLAACHQDPKDVDDVPVDGDADTDADTDSDTDTDLPDLDGDGFATDVDCDDADEGVFPGAPDLCGDDRVTDCDRESDDGLVTVAGATSYADLQEALDAAVSGDALLVCPGTYTGPFEAAVPVSLASHGGRDVTTLDADGGSVLRLPGDSAVAGFTIRDGRSGRGGGILMTSTGTFTVDDCLVTENRAEIGGGIALFPGADAVIRDSSILENSAGELGGGIDGADGSLLELTGTVVENNAALFGGGISLLSGEIVGGVFRGNVAELPAMGEERIGEGGGLYGVGTITLTATEFDGNEAMFGGGMSFAESTVSLVDVPVHGNTTSQWGTGGGIFGWLTALTLTGTSEVYGNSADWSGGGIAVSSGGLVGGVVRDNAAGTYGGGIAMADATLDGVTVTGNTSESGGGIQVGRDGDTIRSCTVTDNVATLLGGGIVAPFGGEEVEPDEEALVMPDTGGGFDPEPVGLADTVVSRNQAERGGGIYSRMAVEMTDGELADNVATATGGGLEITDGRAILEGVSILRNGAGVGGGVALDEEGGVSSIGSDWGTDADDNQPDDVWTGEAPYSGYGVATFDCDATGCLPTP